MKSLKISSYSHDIDIEISGNQDKLISLYKLIERAIRYLRNDLLLHEQELDRKFTTLKQSVGIDTKTKDFYKASDAIINEYRQKLSLINKNFILYPYNDLEVRLVNIKSVEDYSSLEDIKTLLISEDN